MTQSPVNALSLTELVEAFRPLAPVDPARPVNLHTVVAFVALHRRGWRGVLASRSTAMRDLKQTCSIHMCLHLQGVSLNSRGETFEQMWIDGEPPGSQSRPKLDTLTISTMPSGFLLETVYDHNNLALFEATNEAVERALVHRALSGATLFPDDGNQSARRF